MRSIDHLLSLSEKTKLKAKLFADDVYCQVNQVVTDKTKFNFVVQSLEKREKNCKEI